MAFKARVAAHGGGLLCVLPLHGTIFITTVPSSTCFSAV